ncbi:MAG: hypothetical protein QS748_09735 [Candidatus Endonucleobacter bathymodioli]|uniref:Uncharacterized protein n=1 Tax=Candidatus Endonucleibacter bathymodioli TaxID=539814 RepID=A0AA90SN07_9GAMM|nr:hypothetical protein [Candidatus Endonucleobacter bathymodioli]
MKKQDLNVSFLDLMTAGMEQIKNSVNSAFTGRKNQHITISTENAGF